MPKIFRRAAPQNDNEHQLLIIPYLLFTNYFIPLRAI